MKTKSEWKFSAPLAEVDVLRILREAEESHPDVKCVRFKVADELYTAVKAIPGAPASDYMSRDFLKIVRDGKGGVQLQFTAFASSGVLKNCWFFHQGDVVKQAVDRVETTVEVF